MSNNETCMSGGVHKIQTAYFCSECGNLYDISNTPPDEQHSEQETEKKSKSKFNVEQSKKIYFVCTTCGNTELVKPRTLIFSKKSSELSKEYFGVDIDPNIIINSPIALHTRDYICPNKTCKSHASPELRNAVMSKFGNSYKVYYVCTVCKSIWKC